MKKNKLNSKNPKYTTIKKMRVKNKIKQKK